MNLDTKIKKILPLTAKVDSLGALAVGNIKVSRLVERFGTPLYVYDKKTIRESCKNFSATFAKYSTKEVKVSYSAKAFIAPSLLKIVANQNLGLDVVSKGELLVAKRASFDPKNISLHGNSKTKEELEAAVENGVGCVVVDGFSEIETLAKIASANKTVQNVLLRLSPAVDPKTHRLTATGLSDSKFGFAIENGDAYKAVEKVLSFDSLLLEGVHFHLGSPLFSVEPYIEAINYIVQVCKKITTKYQIELKTFNSGGGFATNYVELDQAPELDVYAKTITKTFEKACQKHSLNIPTLAIETGRAIVARAGMAFYTVVEKKELLGTRNFVAVDGGMGDNVRPALYGAKHSVFLANKMGHKKDYLCTIAGRYCESGDLLAKDVLLPNPEPGDIVALAPVGAYSLAMASNYNMVRRPAVVMVDEGEIEVICKRESYNQMLSRYA